MRKEKRKSYLNFSFYHYQRFSRIFGRKWESVKSAIYHKRCVQLDNLLRRIVINTLNSHQFWRIRSTCVTKVGCPFWTCLMYPLNFKYAESCNFWYIFLACVCGLPKFSWGRMMGERGVPVYLCQYFSQGFVHPPSLSVDFCFLQFYSHVLPHLHMRMRWWGLCETHKF